jgi:predicted RNase H-like HicB family nuclease
MNSQKPAYHVILENAGGGVWTAEIPAFRAVTEGRGEAGARAMAADLIAGYIRFAKRDGVPVPKPDAVVPKLIRAVRRNPREAARRRKKAA